MWICQIDWTAVGTLLLVGVTLYYAISTYYILKESQRTREATESLAESSQQSTQIMKQQAEQAVAISRTIVASAINAARTNIEQWKRIDIFSYAVHFRIPENVNLVPLNAQSAIEHSRLISSEGTFDLIGAFENLRRASWELSFLSKCHPSDQTVIRDHSKNALNYMETASTDLEAARTYFAEAISYFSKKKDVE